jgi:site-specific DNA-methyltransferase (cytosine-N4-specific)
MPIGLAEFFIKFLTEPGDLVLDPFGGSNTTGAAAERLGRRWITIEPNIGYIEGSKGRFHSLLKENQTHERRGSKVVEAAA